jgi:hypothetical protein
MVPSKRFRSAYSKNYVHWADLKANEGWPYDMATSNMIYSTAQTVLPQASLKFPNVMVSPMTRVTNRASRLGENPQDRAVAAFVVQELVNWRIREFDFRKQVKLAQADDYFRGRGVIRHGYAADDDVERDLGKRRIEFNHHQHIRPGWPYAVHVPIDDVRFDPTTDLEENRQWVSFNHLWRVDDLKAYDKFTVPRGLEADHLVGVDEDDPEDVKDDARKHKAVIGRVLVQEIWDRRRKEVIYWVPSINKEIGVEDWPLEFEGLPITELSTTLDGTAEPDLYWELQQQLNKLISMVLVYAKRGVPLIGLQRGALNDEDQEKVIDAEILEILLVNGVPKDVIQMISVQPVPQTILMAIAMVKDEIREITGQSKLSRGTRENVESATEAALIGEGASVRVEDRITAVREFFERVIRKDFQTLQQTVREDQVIDLAPQTESAILLRIEPRQIRFEFDFKIELGSMQPSTDVSAKQDAMAVLQASQSHPEIVAQFTPRALARMLARAFNLDERTFLAPLQAATDQISSERLLEMSVGPTGRTESSGQGVGAALDATKNRGGNGATTAPAQGGAQTPQPPREAQ